ncbi:GNAT family N-acetyltransferase [Acidaminobacter sp. JC074]|uniref:GNAT family N-acetyltransferase n=1 Tax=Acidaminobacter sp. JC074 TaxID=2530199 RepID=UPI001F104A38|nr:GNAT family N-acetyltransferase [Acidaminobacter sp. JC074]
MIRGKLVELRLMKKEDIELFVQLTNDTSHTGQHFPYIVRTLSDTIKHYNEDGFFSPSGGRLLIFDLEDNLVGAISYFKNAHYVEGYELGYQIFRQENRGKGYVSEALKLFSAFLFEHYPINRLQICMEKDNLASEAVAKKCGFVYEGTMRDAWTVGGRKISNLTYSMIRDEAPKLKDLL